MRQCSSLSCAGAGGAVAAGARASPAVLRDGASIVDPAGAMAAMPAGKLDTPVAGIGDVHAFDVCTAMARQVATLKQQSGHGLTVAIMMAAKLADMPTTASASARFILFLPRVRGWRPRADARSE